MKLTKGQEDILKFAKDVGLDYDMIKAFRAGFLAGEKEIQLFEIEGSQKTTYKISEKSPDVYSLYISTDDNEFVQYLEE